MSATESSGKVCGLEQEPTILVEVSQSGETLSVHCGRYRHRNLDILVNNAGISGLQFRDVDELIAKRKKQIEEMSTTGKISTFIERDGLDHR
jgi:hypothetical protein